MSVDDGKTKEQLLAEIEALKDQLAKTEGENKADAKPAPVLATPMTRREAIINWIAPVILTVPVLEAALRSGTAEAARCVVAPTATPTTAAPTAPPTAGSTFSPTSKPSRMPTVRPSLPIKTTPAPIAQPTRFPSASPTNIPSFAPTFEMGSERPGFGHPALGSARAMNAKVRFGGKKGA